MNESARKKIHEDYREVLSSEAGKRILGGIFYECRLTYPGMLNEFQQGRRSIAVQIENTIREVNPYGLADCLTAYEDFMKEYRDDERRDNADTFDSE